MNAKQISTVMGRLVEHQSRLHTLSSEDGQWIIQHPKDAIDLFMKTLEDQRKRISVEPRKVFKLVNGISLPIIEDEFVVKEMFAENNHPWTSTVSNSFKEYFYDLVEGPIKSGFVYASDLLMMPTNAEIVALLDINNLTTSLSEIFMLIQLQEQMQIHKQEKWETNRLIWDCGTNIFFVPDVCGELRQVSCKFSKKGWQWDANHLDSTFSWNCGCRVFSRDLPERLKDINLP